MLKKLVEKRIEAFKALFPDYKVAKKTGNIYHKEDVGVRDRKVLFTGVSVTKNTLDRIGETIEWKEQSYHYMCLITTKGKLMLHNGSSWKSVTLKTVRTLENLATVFFIGKKYEWMKDYPNLWKYKYFQSFQSLSEARNFLGYTFISCRDFYSMFKGMGRSGNVCFDVMVLANDKKNAYKLLKNMDIEDANELDDYIMMCYNNGIKPEIPAGKNKLKKLHDDLTFELSKKQIESYCKEQIYFPEGNEEFERTWKERGLKFNRLNTEYEMGIEGALQKHCLGTSYRLALNNRSFYAFTYKGHKYDLELHTNGNFGQFQGYNNRFSPPSELVDKISKDVDLAHKIKLKEGMKELVCDNILDNFLF